jgi:SAM-dependent methyltransferase
MAENINTKEYWESRFSSDDWTEKGGRLQTAGFARSQMDHIPLPADFSGEILDFGCGLGDAIPVYKKRFPFARLSGMDISESAIEKCTEVYGEMARFFQGDYRSIPSTDVIIASNVLEHLSHDLEIARHLLSRCKFLYITVPYKEQPICSEHVNSYDEYYFREIGNYEYHIFLCPGWTQYGLRGLTYNVYFKNIFRFLTGRKTVNRNKQIMFRFTNEKS